MMAKIRGALTTRSPRALADAAHGLKGSVGNFGMSSAFETAREMEKTGRQGKLDGGWELYATLEDDMRDSASFRQVLGNSKSKRTTNSRPDERPLHHSPRRKR